MKNLVNDFVAASDDISETNPIIYLVGGMGFELEPALTILGINP